NCVKGCGHAARWRSERPQDCLGHKEIAPLIDNERQVDNERQAWDHLGHAPACSRAAVICPLATPGWMCYREVIHADGDFLGRAHVRLHPFVQHICPRLCVHWSKRLENRPCRSTIGRNSMPASSTISTTTG